MFVNINNYLKNKYSSIEDTASMALATGLSLFACVLAWNHKWISDDGYIYLAFARNIIEFNQFGYNSGELVDASTSFIWLLLLTLTKVVLPFLTYEQISHVLSLLFVFLGIYKLVTYSRISLMSVTAVVLLTAPYFMRSFFTSGLETPLILFSLIYIFVSKFRSPAVMALLPFIRPELFIITLVGLFNLTRHKLYKKVIILIITGMCLAIARWLIYGDILPNTVFAKIGYNNYGQGIIYLQELLLSYWAILSGIAVAIIFLSLKRDGVWSEENRYLAALFIFYSIYPVLTGGDFMHGRFFLPAYLLLVLLFYSLFTKTSRKGPIAYNFESGVSIFLLFIAMVYLPESSKSTANQLEKGRTYKGIADERLSYLRNNPVLGNWHFETKHPWALEGKTLTALADFLGLKVGTAAGAIGQKRLYSDPSKVYLYDKFSLTQPVGTMIDQGGWYRRVGHNAMIPDVLLYLNPNINLLNTPDKELNELLAIEFDGNRYVLWEPGNIRELEVRGIYKKGTRSKLDDLLMKRLSDQYVSDSLVFFLYHRGYPDKDISSRVNTLYQQSEKNQFSLAAWFRRNGELITLSRNITEGRLASFPFRYHALLKERKLKPLEFPRIMLGQYDAFSDTCLITFDDANNGADASRTSIHKDTIHIDKSSRRQIKLKLSVDLLDNDCDTPYRFITVKLFGDKTTHSRSRISYKINDSRWFDIYHEKGLFQEVLDSPEKQFVLTIKVPRNYHGSIRYTALVN